MYTHAHTHSGQINLLKLRLACQLSGSNPLVCFSWWLCVFQSDGEMMLEPLLPYQTWSAFDRGMKTKPSD